MPTNLFMMMTKSLSSTIVKPTPVAELVFTLHELSSDLQGWCGTETSRRNIPSRDVKRNPLQHNQLSRPKNHPENLPVGGIVPKQPAYEEEGLVGT